MGTRDWGTILTGQPVRIPTKPFSPVRCPTPHNMMRQESVERVSSARKGER